jgi:S-disulfanyl-L-cysteine oxidoreductase SoxD
MRLADAGGTVRGSFASAPWIADVTATVASIVLVATVASCGGDASSASSGGDGPTDAAGAIGAGTPEGLPTNAPSSFGFGAEASAARVAMWDIDVRPDGTGLPRGSGSVDQGRAVFMTQCVACHGPTGVEGPNDRLVDSEQWDVAPTTRTVGNYWPYATTLFDYIRKAMPQLTPGTLSEDEVYAVIAYILFLNEIVPEDAVMNAETLPAVVMPARDKFVVDDRVGGVGPIR